MDQYGVTECLISTGLAAGTDERTGKDKRIKVALFYLSACVAVLFVTSDG
jgi:hypothetical protein